MRTKNRGILIEPLAWRPNFCRETPTLHLCSCSIAALQARVPGQLKLVQYRVELHDVSTSENVTGLRFGGVELTPAADPKQGTPKIESDEESRPWHPLAMFSTTWERHETTV